MDKKIIPAVVLVSVVLLGGIAYAAVRFNGNKKPATQIGDSQRFAQQGAGGKNIAGSRRAGGFNAAFGKIISNDGTSITMSLDAGGSAIAFYSETTKISKIIEAAAGDLAVGQNITANGVKNDDGSISVDMVQIVPLVQRGNASTTIGGPGGNRMPGGSGSSTAGVNQQDQPQSGGVGNNQEKRGFAMGMITARDGAKITAKSINGTEQTVILSDSAKIYKTVDASAADFVAGTPVSVTGSKNSDGSVTAKSIQINPVVFNGTR